MKRALDFKKQNSTRDDFFRPCARDDLRPGLYRVFIKYCVFSLKCFLNSASSAAALVFYLPGVCTQTDTEGKQSPEFFKKFGKKHNI